MATIRLPNNWRPRDYQMPLWRYLEQGGKRAIGIWHRRAGKDDVLLHRTAVAAFERPATYWHALPEYGQARKALWNAVNPMSGKRRIDEAFPAELRENTNEQEMFIRFKNGSTWQLIGSDRYNSLVGAGVAGVTFSEFALANPSAWGYISPMIRENNGWAAFITTPRGRNHAYDMFNMAGNNPDWFAEKLSAIETRAFTPEELEEIRQTDYISIYGQDMGQSQFEQEYLCSFNAAILGAFYAREMADVRAEGRIDPDLIAADAPVHRAWDLGVRDDTSIWWWQVVGAEIYVLDCYSASGVGLDHYRDVIEQRHDEHGWAHGVDWVPHDARVRELGTGRTRVETMQGLGLNPQLVPNAGLLDGINALRRTLPRCVFHDRCSDGISALESYRREWDDDKKTYRASPLHDWCFTAETPIATRHGMCQIGSLPSEGEVLTPCGWKPYTNPRITRRAAPLVEVRFKDGLSVRCTPDHMFLTESGWKSAERLETGSKILSSWTTLRSILWAASIACGQTKNTFRKVAKGFTATFGKMLSGRFLAVATSTIGTLTRSTTQLRILSACRHQTTGSAHGMLEKSAASLSPFQSWQERTPQHGIVQKKAGNGIGEMPSTPKAGQSGSVSRARASIAALSSLALSVQTGISTSIAALTARPRIIESVKPVSYLSDVWCITVPGYEAFSLSNGAVVHNCSHYADSARYMALAWRQYRPAPLPDPVADPIRQPGVLRAPPVRGRNSGSVRI